MDNNVLSKVEAFDLLLKAKGFKNTHIHNKFKEMFEIEEKDTWNLVDDGYRCNDCKREGQSCMETHSINTFIQKVKEDMDKHNDSHKKICDKHCIIFIDDLKDAIDKRAGNFK